MPKPFKIKQFRKHGIVGEEPGSIRIAKDALASRIHILTLTHSGCEERDMNSLNEALEWIDGHHDQVNWLQIKGLANMELLKGIGDKFNLNPLVMEDISDTTQRPKYEEYETYIFAISRLIFFDQDQQANNDQLSVILSKKLLISFQETYDEFFIGLKNRLKISKGMNREGDSGYLFYAILDTVYDRYFDLLDQLEDALAILEENINSKPRRQNMREAQRIKRILILLHRATWPERDKMNEILRSDDPLITKKDKIFMRDAYDHCIDIIETIHSQKELASNLTDIYLSTINNQMNDVMRILTIVSAIFIPLSFIAGLYGMNFARIDPVTGKAMPNNMPELYSPRGYLYTLAVMAGITVVQMIIFWRKGWFNKLK